MIDYGSDLLDARSRLRSISILIGEILFQDLSLFSSRCRGFSSSFFVFFLSCGEFFFFKVFKLDPKRRSQRYMAGQEVQQSSNTSSAAAVGAGMYDVGDAGDAAMSKYLQSTGMQHLASSSTSALDQKLIPNQLAQVLIRFFVGSNF